MFKYKINIKSFFENGYMVNELNEDIASNLLEEIKKEHWVKVKKEEISNGIVRREYKDRYISKRGLFQPQNLKPVYKSVLNEFEDHLEVLLSQYDISGNTLTPFLGMSGYMMESHSDLGDRALAIAIVYLSEDSFNDHTGGELNLYRVNLDLNGKVINRELIDVVYPNNGQIIIINPNDPRFEHEVKEVNSDLKRYQLFITLGTDNVNDWNYDFDEKEGFIESDKEYSLNIENNI